MKYTLYSVGLWALFGIFFIQCAGSDSKKDNPIGNSDGSNPIEMKLSLLRDQEICESPFSFNATIEWEEGYIYQDCIEIKSVSYGCSSYMSAPPDAAVGDEGQNDTNPDYHFGCDPGVTRTLTIINGNETLVQETMVDADVVHELDPPFRFCVGDGKIGIVINLEASSTVENGDLLELSYIYHPELQAMGEPYPSKFQESILYVVSDEGCYLFPWQNMK